MLGLYEIVAAGAREFYGELRTFLFYDWTNPQMSVCQGDNHFGNHQAFSISRNISFFMERAAYSRQARISSVVKCG